MKKTLSAAVLFLLLSFIPCAAREKKAAAGTPSPKAAEKSVTYKGLFTVIKTGSEWFFEIPDSLVGRRFLTTVRYTSTPAATDTYGGELANEQTVYWQVAPDDRLLLRSELLVNVADSVDAINRAIIISNENPIIGAFKVESHRNGMYRIKVTSFFNEDNPAIGVSRGLKTDMGLQGYVPAASYIEGIKTFPMNTEVRTVKTWTSSTRNTYAGAYTGKVTLGLNVSFILLPEKPMLPRLFDPRVGYFTDSYNYYSDNQQRVERKRFITRWRLEPKDSADAEKMRHGELVEPKKPIVYYIDPATPKQWRPYLIQGVNDWQVAFEQAGFKNAIIGKEWPENDSTMSMEDARYSVIRYLASPIPNAYGPQVHDPRTGEILESHICWYHNVMTLVHDWYMVQAGSIDEAARCMRYDEELMGQLIRFVSSHEVGHTLGLRHNFGSSSTVPVDSLRSKAWVEKYGHTPSIMDYARFNYVAQPEDSISQKGIFPRIGDYDCWAIRWGYTPMPDAYDSESDHWELEKLTSSQLKGNRRLWFGDGETNTTNDSRCQTEDLGDDAVKAGEYGILNLRRELQALPEWTYESNDIYNSNLSGMFSQISTQFFRYVMHVAANIGGVYNDYKTVDEPGVRYTDVSRDKQKDALAFLNRHVFNEPSWLIGEPYIKRIYPDPQAWLASFGHNMLSRIVSYSKLDRLNAEYPVEDYLADVERMLFSELSSGTNVSHYRRRLQNAFVATLTGYMKDSSLLSPARPAVLSTLQDLRQKLARATAADKVTKAHYASLYDAVNRALEVK